MGAFQAVASGLGEAGEQASQGLNNAEQTALKLRQQSHLENVDASHIALAQAMQKQQYNIAQQQHELMHQQILQNNNEDLGVTFNPKDGNYIRSFRNKTTNEITGYPLAQGSVPPDSPQSLVNQVQFYRGQTDDGGKRLFTDRQVTEKVFGLHDLYRQDPAGVVAGFRQDAQDLAKDGTSKVKVPGFGIMDISTPQGQANYAQAMADSFWGKGSFLRAAMGLGPGQRDTTGWTAGEKREYDALRVPAERQAAVISHMADVQIANTTAAFDPEQQKIIKKQMMEDIDKVMKPVEERAAEISNRHHAAIPFQVPTGAPSPAGKPDGFELVNKQNQVIARVKGGRYVAP